MIFLVELNNPLILAFSNGKFNTLLGQCYIEILCWVRYPASLSQHNFTENTHSNRVVHGFTVAKDLDTDLAETKHPTKITLLSILRQASIYRYFEYIGGCQYIFAFLTHESPLFVCSLVLANGLVAINFGTPLVDNLILHRLSPAVNYFLFHATSVGDAPCQSHLPTSLNTKLLRSSCVFQKGI